MEELKYLKSGYQRFREKYFKNENTIFQNLAISQNPKALIIGCSDSRVDPAIIMDCKPGDLFLVRNVANLVPPYEAPDNGYHGTSAALEFGVCHLEVEQIIIIGHSSCGGIASLFENNKQNNQDLTFINKWMDLVANLCHHDSIDEIHDQKNKINQCSKLAIINSLANLKSFPWIKSRINDGKLNIHGWYFNIKTGTIEQYDSKLDKFQEL